MAHVYEHELWRGLRVIWNYVPRGGYGFVIPVPATVVKAGRERVTIDAERVDGSTVRRVVKRESVLRPCVKCRPKPHSDHCTSACKCSERTRPRPAEAAKGGDHGR